MIGENIDIKELYYRELRSPAGGLYLGVFHESERLLGVALSYALNSKKIDLL